MTKSQAIPEIYFFLIEIVLVLLSGGIIYERVTAVEDSHLFEQKFFVRDVALVLNVLPSVDGNVFFKYDPPLLANNDIGISGKYVESGRERYPFAAGQQFNNFLEKPEFLAFYKEGDAITVSKSERDWNPFQLKCPDVPTTFTKLIIDPAFGRDDVNDLGTSGDEGVAGKESALVRVIAGQLFGRIGSALAKEVTRDVNTEQAKSVQERVQFVRRQQQAAVLGLSVGKYDATKNVLRLYMNANGQEYERSYKLACVILNEVTKQKEIRDQLTGAVIVPVNVGRLKADDSSTTAVDEDDIRKVLLPDRVGVYAELGNIDKQGNKLVEPAIKDVLFAALEVYRQ